MNSDKFEGCLLNLVKIVVSVLLKYLECNVRKLKYKKLEVREQRIRNKADLPIRE